MTLKNIRISKKLGFLIAFSLAGMFLITLYDLVSLRSELIAERRIQTQNIIGTVYSVLEDLETRVQKKELTLEDAQENARQYINAIRYDGNEYIWVNSEDLKMLVHPLNPDLVGKDVSAVKDANGFEIFKEIQHIINEPAAQGSLRYFWLKPGDDNPTEKISYVSAFKPWGWVIGTGVYLDKIDLAFTKQAVQNFFIFILIASVITIFTLKLSRDIAKSVGILSRFMTKLAEGNTDTYITLIDRKDEFGDMARTVNIFRDNMIENERLSKEKVIEDQKQQKRMRLIEKLANDFDNGVNIALESVASAAKQLDMTANSMSSTAAQTSEQASSVATASEQTSNNVQTVASAAEQLSSSIREVGQQVLSTSKIAQNAVERVNHTRQTVDTLTKTAEEIKGASRLIGEIADQTNMLALNATIESARAGEMGKGFAVVASEVKSLAQQTTHATEEINKRVMAIQAVSQKTVEAIADIDKVIHEMSSIAASVSSAVEEQSAATSEISRNIYQAANGTKEVNSNIILVNSAANDTGAASKEVLNASSLLNSQSVSLREIVESFLTKVKSA